MEIRDFYQLLKRDHTLFQFMQKSPLDGIWYWDIETGEVLCNERCASIVGYTLEELKTPIRIHRWRSLIHPDDRAIYQQTLFSHLHSEAEEYACEVRVRHKDGEWIWVRDAGRVVSYTATGAPAIMGGTLFDDTEKMKSQVELFANIAQIKNQDELLKQNIALLESTIESDKGLLVCSIDDDFNIRLFNNNFKLATQQAYGVVVEPGMNILSFVNQEEDRHNILTSCRKALLGESHVTIKTFGDVYVRYFETRYNPIVQEEGITGVTIISADITTRILEEEHVKSLNAELESFSNTVAQDLKDPARIISSYVQILREDAREELSAENKRVLEILERNALYMDNLINSLLAFFKLGLELPDFFRVNMRNLIELVVKDVLNGFEEEKDRVDLRIQTIDNVLCDRNLIHQVFFHLLSNAIKFSSKNECITIEVGSERRTAEVVYYVKDNGIGLDMQHARTVFKLFSRLQRGAQFRGTGVGLAIVQRVINKHGGSVWVESKPNQGATFYFSIPVNLEARNTSAQKNAPETFPMQRSAS